jgi:hypothetical protein
VAIITRSDLLMAHALRLDDTHRRERSRFWAVARTWRRRKSEPAPPAAPS